MTSVIKGKSRATLNLLGFLLVVMCFFFAAIQGCSDGDVETTAQIAAGLPTGHITDLAGKTTLAACDVVLTNDTGPMHAAAAVGTPVVVPFGSTSPDFTGPGLPDDPDSPHQLLRTSAPCSPCFLRKCPIDLRCLNEITAANAVAAVGKILCNKPLEE